MLTNPASSIEDKTPLWLKSLKKSLANNNQLDFIKFFNVSYLSLDSQEAEIEMLKFKRFHFVNDNKFLIATCIDNRGKLFQSIANNKKAEILWYFPLSKEKYRIKCHLSVLRTPSDQVNYEFLREEKTNIWDDMWNKFLDKEERKEFMEPIPDTLTVDKEKFADLDKYNTPEKNEASSNLAVVLFDPYIIDLTIFTMPQVIADSRAPKYESLFQPYKKNKRYVHSFDLEKDKWLLQVFNP